MWPHHKSRYDMEKLFFDSWDSLFRTFIITILAYAAMVALLRASGKRTLSKMNAFDFVITVALGSSMATVALNKQVALTDGVLAFALLIFLQYFVSTLAIRFRSFRKLVTAQPSLLLYKGELIEAALRKERILKEEILTAARKKGIASLQEIDMVILETTGELTILSGMKESAETLSNVKRL